MLGAIVEDLIKKRESLDERKDKIDLDGEELFSYTVGFELQLRDSNKPLVAFLTFSWLGV
jgi:hypothetical protein